MAGVISTWCPVRWRFIDDSFLAWLRQHRDGSDTLAEIRGLDVHRLAVFRHRAACDLDALLPQDVGNAVVRERLLAVLGGDQLLDERADRRRRARAARVG